MNILQKTETQNAVGSALRRAVLSYLVAVTIEYFLLPVQTWSLEQTDGLALMSLSRVGVLTGLFWLLLWRLEKRYRLEKAERFAVAGVFLVLAAAVLWSSFTPAFLVACGLIFGALLVWALRGWDDSPERRIKPKPEKRPYLWVAVGLSVAFFLFVSLWTVCRVYSFSTPTYDFGIFSQMFYHMKTSGAPLTTVERDGLLSHFAVHMSPVYYLLLPFYALVPTPATLQVLQAAVITSAVIPLWLLSGRHGLKGWQRTILCALLLLYPSFSGGTSYDIHENCFLTPLILWLFYGTERKSPWITAVAALLTLLVKEDAAVYVAVIALYLVLHALLRREEKRKWTLTAGLLLLAGSLCWFFAVTGYLAGSGDGVMTYRYDNFIYDDSGSLLTVIKAVILNPMKAVFECVETEKLRFIGLTMLPLVGFPLLTRRFERYILLIPYILVNLMSDYQYQHDIFFQYTFGSTAFLFYLTLINLGDLRPKRKRTVALLLALAVSIGCFGAVVVPKAAWYPEKCLTYGESYDAMRQTLSLIPDDATVTATTFYTTFLSQREILYDVRYSSKDHLLSTEYIALAVNEDSSYRKYGGFEGLVSLLEREGYSLFAQIEGTLVIYRRES